MRTRRVIWAWMWGGVLATLGVAACGSGRGAARPAPDSTVVAAAPVAHEPLTCSEQSCPPDGSATHDDDDDDHGGHHHDAPHGGALVELGNEFAHLEIVLDSALGQLTVYVLDGEASTGVRLRTPSLRLTIQLPSGAPPFELALSAVANPLTGETAEESSVYIGQDSRLTGVGRLTGKVGSVTVRGQTFSDVSISYPEDSHDDH